MRLEQVASVFKEHWQAWQLLHRMPATVKAILPAARVGASLAVFVFALSLEMHTGCCQKCHTNHNNRTL